MPRGLIVPADDNIPATVRDFNALEDYQAAVQGLIEPLNIDALGITMVLNEEGRLHGLPFNPRITFLQWFHEPRVRNRTMLVGSAILVGLPNGRGEHSDVPPEVVFLFEPDSRFVVEVRVGSNDWVRHSSPLTYSEAAVWSMLIEEQSPVPVQVKVTSA